MAAGNEQAKRLSGRLLTPRLAAEGTDAALNAIFAEFAAAFTGKVKGHGDVALPERLARAQLDSLDSLKAVDAYLAHVRAHRERLGELELDNSMLWGGAYVGR